MGAENQNRGSDNHWFSWQSEELFVKNDWFDTLFGKLRLDERELFYLFDFLLKYKMIDVSDDNMKILVPFTLYRKDESVCIEIPYQDNGKERYIQYLMRILNK
ncbi:MAG: hypothetical protein ACE5J2_08395 [Nitrososphaerales archaeon]